MERTMNALPKANRKLTKDEEIVELQYRLKQFTRLLSLVGKEIGQDKIIEIAKSNEYPKTKEQIIEMIEQGRGLKDVNRYQISTDGQGIGHLQINGEWVKWEDIEKLIE